MEYKESGASSWISWVGGTQASVYFTGLSTTVTGLTKGTTYQFRVSALNIHGTSATTDPVLEATTDNVPSAPNAPSTTSEGLTVKIDWAAPTDNGSPIQNYTITVQNSAASFVEVDGCDGTDSATVQNTECSVTMQTLRDTLGLSYGVDILAKIQATNLVGSGANSTATDSGTAAKVETAPQSPSGVSLSAVQSTSISINWSSLTTGA